MERAVRTVSLSLRRSALPLLFILHSFLLIVPASAEIGTCKKVVQELNKQLLPKINEYELTDILKTLNSTENKKLPRKFVTKKQARARGWKPGKNLWSVLALKKKSLGGDVFENLEGRLPQRHWREADLDYRGGRRGGKRLIYSDDGMRMVTVDHYQMFTEVPACR
jgi:hypothetical protein